MIVRRSTAVSRLPVLIGALLLMFCGRDGATPQARLHAAYAELQHRPFELRLSGFAYRPPAKTTRGGGEPDYGLQAAAGEALEKERVDVRLRAAARAFLRDWPAAVAELEAALAKTPSDAVLWSDLAVHQFELARRGVEPRALGQALASADRAIELDPSRPEPLFNRAAILEAMHLRAIAARAWREAAARESGTPWAEEARRRATSNMTSRRDAWKSMQPRLEQAALAGQAAILEEALDHFAREVRTTAEAATLAAWAELQLAGNDEAATKQLRIARYIGERLQKRSGETLLHRAVMAIDEARGQGRGHVVARAYAEYKRARLLIHERKPGQADEVMARAERLFRDARSPMELVARAYRVGIAFDRNRISEATALLDSLEQKLTPDLVALRAQVHWDRARLASRRGDIHAVIAHSSTAAEVYERLREHDFAIRMQSMAATALTRLGRVDHAWQSRLRTFAGASTSGDPELIEHVLHAAAKEEILEQRFNVAAALFGIMRAEPPRSPVRRFEGVLWRAFAASRTGTSATTHLQALAAAAEAIPDDELRAVADADRWLAEALLLRETQPRHALKLLTKAIETREARGVTETLADVYVVRAQLHRRLGASEEAERDLRTALDNIERQREEVEPVALRDSFFGAAETACTELIDFYARREQFAAAFHASERCRARSLVDVAAGLHARPVTADDVRRQLRPDVAFVHYTVLSDRLLIVLFRRADLVVRTVSIARSDLERQAAALIGAMEKRDDATADRLLRSLHAKLIAPIASELDRTHLAISPDAVLERVPFAALRNTSGRYLVEDAAITIAPSATLFLSARPRRRDSSTRALFVGDPAFDPAAHDLPRLPGAGREARELAAHYPDAVLLTGASATPERFASAIERADLVHVASHAVVSARDTALSSLVLAPSAASNGLVYQASIAEMQLRGQPLVILAGCRTASVTGGRGSIRSLALAFLAAGSRAVIGSLWNVEDDATRTVSRLLHQRLTTAPTADAAREMQLALIRSDDYELRNPATWGAFELYGFEEENTR